MDGKLDLPALRFHGGITGSLAPFTVFLMGVAWLGLSGAPDERGLWPVLLAALALGLMLARDRSAYSETIIRGMSQPIVTTMILAWLLAGVLGALMSEAGLIEALVWLARRAGVAGGGYVAAVFLICCVVSTSTGTSIGTILLCGPLLYPTGGSLGVNPPVLIGAILGGSTFGDNVSPISDTTIASSLTQEAKLGRVVRSRLKYALPAATCALALYALLGGSKATTATNPRLLETSPRGLIMVLAPALVLWLLLRGCQLLEGLLHGIVACVVLALFFHLIEPAQLLYIDPSTFSAKGIVLDGLQRGVGASIFTFFLMGLVAALQASGLVDRLVELARKSARTVRGAELWIFGSVSVAALLTTHSVVAILAVGPFARETGERLGIDPYRRANLLDVTVCTYPFLFPYFIPVILAAGTTATGSDLGMPRLSPLTSGLYNFHSWMLLVVVTFAVLTGYGRRDRVHSCASESGELS